MNGYEKCFRFESHGQGTFDFNDDLRAREKTMTLNLVFKLHAWSAWLFAVPLLIAPAWVSGLLVSQPLNEVGELFGRLYGLGCGYIGVGAWLGTKMQGDRERILIARSLLACETVGIGIGLTIPSGPDWHFARAVTLGFYLLFVIFYVVVLYIRPRVSD
jgi:hypothetical protein